MSNLFDRTTNALASTINMRVLKQNVISSNVANAETPGYKAKKVDFEEALSRALDQEGSGRIHAESPDHFLIGQGAIGRVKADIYDNPDVNTSPDGNTVDLEREMAALAENAVLYRAAIQLINKKLGAMKYALSEGSR
jgi:flagellar basal-body rod protein FlgB